MSRKRHKILAIHLPKSLLNLWQEMEWFYNRGDCPIRIGDVETTTRAELLHQVVTLYCLGGWGDPSELDSPDKDEAEAEAEAVLHIKLREQEANKWLVWIRDGHAHTHSELARRAMELYLQWWKYRRWQDQQRFQKILELGTRGEIPVLRTVPL